MTPGRFLCANDAERARLLDMHRRLRPVEPLGFAAVALAALLGAGTFGWLAFVPGLAAIAVFAAGAWRLEYQRRPEVVVAVTFVTVELLLAVAVGLANSQRSYLFPVLVLPMLLACVLFPVRVIVVGDIMTALLIVTVGLIADRHEVYVTPPVLWAPIIAMIVLTISGTQARNLDADARSTAVVDRLTGALNRAALAPRVAELAHQSGVTGEQVAVVIGDVDHFKQINDEHGHTVGDDVLRGVARRLSACLNSFEPVYRLGGEEFMVLLGATDVAAAVELAQRLRRSIGETPIEGLAVTMSFGVAASECGQRFDFELTFGRADAALYKAKSNGRDRVCIGGHSQADQRRAAVADEDVAAPIVVDRHSNDHADLPAPPSDLVAVEATAVGAWRERLTRERAATGSWLLRDALEREHLLDLGRRLRVVFAVCAVMVFVAIAAAGPWFGWLTIVPSIAAGAAYNAIEFRLERMRRPEYGLAIGWLLLQGSIAGGFMLSHGSPLFVLVIFTSMVVGSSAVFPTRGVVIGVLYTASLMVLAALVVNAHLVAANPAVLALGLAELLVASLTGWAVGQSTIDHRGASVVDHLTGLLNRAALEARVAELSHQSRVTGEPVAIIVADLDRFKSVNDRFGHARGDLVLREVAYRIRKSMRAFESAYRFGGEEFVVVLAGVDAAEASEVAERLLTSVRSEPLTGVPVTMSLGVAASPSGEPFDYSRVFADADAALMHAKRSGRDRVEVAAEAGAVVAA